MRYLFKRSELFITAAIMMGALLASADARAQDVTTAAQRVARIEAAMHRVQDDAECLTNRKRELEAVMLLLRDALTQSQGTGAAARDGAAAIESLHTRAAGIERAAIACVHREPLLASNAATTQGAAASGDTHVDAVARENDATRVIERNARLGGDLSVTLAEQADGTGQIASNVIINGVREAAPRLLACFSEVAGTGRRGEMALSFTIGASGRVTHAAVEGDSLGIASVARCVRTVGSSLHFSGGTRGGDAVISYTLRYGAQ